MKNPAWETLGSVSPRQLAPARLLLHHAAQLVAAVGRSLVPPRPDDGNTSLEWTAPHGLTGQVVPGPRAWRATLRFDEPSIEVLAEGAEVSRLSLTGRAHEAAFAWLVDCARGLGAQIERLSLAAPYVLPAHPFGAGTPFEAPGDGSVGELARWFANAHSALHGVAEAWPGAAPLRVWPHHFDLGSVLPLASGHGDDAPSIGIGLSPGDEGIAEPYFYVTPWPAPPAAESLPELPAGGRWHREGWIGAVLDSSEVVAKGGSAAQAAAVSAFLKGAVEALRARHTGGA